jgi:thiamine biosynthesis lipoprotein
MFSTLSLGPCALRLIVDAIMQKFKFILTLIFILFLSTICDATQARLIQGRTMGTTYHIQVVTGNLHSISGLKEKIDTRLEQINNSMSTYQDDSEISRFNRFEQAGDKFKISDDFLRVMTAGQTIYRLSEGAWDATVNPLVVLWGFGPGSGRHQAPPSNEIAALLADIGFSNIEVLAPGFLLKKRASVSVDLSSIAKGYGVDQVADILRQNGFANYLVEIGGEVFAAGHRQDDRQWRIGINRPRADAAADEVYKVVELSNQALATSGDYRNFFEVDGIRYSHVIDPRTGYPVSNGVVSVSIVADNCTLADGLATAVMVMGAEKGLELLDRLIGVEGLIVVAKNDGTLLDYYSKGFE